MVLVEVKVVKDHEGCHGVLLQVDQERWMVMPPDDARRLSAALTVNAKACEESATRGTEG